jgi:cytochrome c oxidase subunit III
VATDLAAIGPLPVGSKGRHASGYWGMITVIVTEAALFAYLLFSYFYIASQAHGAWPPAGLPSFRIALPDTIILILGSVTVWWGERGIRNGDNRKMMLGLAATLVLGIVFLVLQYFEWMGKTFSFTSDVYGSLYYTVTGFHMAHVLIGLLMIATILVWTALGYFGKPRHAAASIGAIYWHFVTVVWLAVFGTFYVAPYL